MNHTTRFAATPEDQLIPRILLRAVGLLIALSLAIVIYAKITGRTPSSAPPQSDIVVQAEVILRPNLAGSVQVFDSNGVMFDELPPETGGFISGVGRVIERQRSLNNLPLEAPVKIRAHANGRLSVLDPSTNWSADLMGFGADNARAFAKLLAIAPNKAKGNHNGTTHQGN